MSYFQKQGRALLANGYLIVPIKPGEKRPALNNWQSARLGASDLTNYPGHGVGVLCGQGAHPICAIDIDVTDSDLADRFADWCLHNLGATVARVGMAPKILLVYRAEGEGWSKATGAWFEDGEGERHRIEVLGSGQQFVAYHTHPDTGAPYEWIDLLGGLESVRADELAMVNMDQVNEALLKFEELAQGAGMVKVGSGRGVYQVDDDPLMEYEPPVGVSLATVAKAMSHVDPNDYDSWIRAGMALHHEFGAEVGALDVWDEWSSKATNYAGRDDLARRWAGFGQNGRITTVRWLLKVGNQAQKVERRNEKRQALQTLLGVIRECDDSIALMEDVAKEARAVLSDVPEIQTEVASAFRKRFHEITGVALPAATLNKALREPSAPTVKARRPLTEFGNSERMLDRYGQGLMFVPEMGSWYCWTGVYWRKSPDVEIEHLAKETVKALVGEIADHPEPAEFFKFCAISQQAKMVRNMVTLAQSDPRVMVPARELDKYSHLMGAANGVIDLRTGDLLPPDPELRITKIAGCDYVPGAKAPLFRQTVVDVFNDDADMVAFFQRLVGYAAMGQPNQDVMVIPHGNGSNGKSTVLGTIRSAFGGYAKAAEAGTFVSDAKGGGNAGAAREDLVRLKGARFVYVNEPDENSELREGSVKAMTGGDAITARGVYGKESVEFLPSWVVFMPTNHKPIVKGSDNGIWRRLMLIPFTRNFEADPTITKDPNRETKLQAEIEGVLAWVVEGALAYQAQGLNQVGAVKAAREAYREQMDLLSEWLEECCEIGPTYEVESSHLWKSWEEYAKNRGLLTYVKNSVALGRRLDARFPAGKGSGGVRIRRGLRIRCDFDDLV